MEDLETWAQAVARQYLDTPRFRATRWPHSRAVATHAMRLAPVCGTDAKLLVAAAWLHDIGYAPGLANADFHPLDGALLLERIGAGDRLVALVAHHSAARYGAWLRGLDRDYRRWPDEDTPVRDALWCADMLTGPTGCRMTFESRQAEIIARYGPGHSVSIAIARSAGRIGSMITVTAQRAAACGIDVFADQTPTDTTVATYSTTKLSAASAG